MKSYTTTVMFVIVLVAAVAAQKKITITDEDKQKYAEVIKTCVESSGVDMELAMKSRKGFTDSDDPKFKEFIFCAYKSYNYINDGNEIQVESIKKDMTKYFGKESGDKFIDECSPKLAATALETAVALNKCYFATFPDHANLEF